MLQQRDHKGDAGHVHIRVVFIGDKSVETRTGVRKEGDSLNTRVPEKYKYKAKGISYYSLKHN